MSRTIQVTWTELKALKTAKNLSFNYDVNADTTVYDVFLGDNDILWWARLTDSGEITDFTTNYQSDANKRTPHQVMIGNNSTEVDIVLDGGVNGLSTVSKVYDGTDYLSINADGSINNNVLSVIPGTGSTNLGKTEDSAHTTGDTGVFVLAVRHDSQASLVDTEFDYAPLQVDELGNLRVVNAGDVDSVELRKGKLFYINAYNSNFGAGQYISIHFTTPSTGKIFLEYAYEITFQGNFQLYEGGSYSGGTAYSPINKNRQSSTTSTLTNVQLNATTWTGTTSLIYKLWGTASQKVFGAGDSGNWILKANTVYHFVITSEKPSNLGWLETSWYEEED